MLCSGRAGLGCRSRGQPWENDPLGMCQCLSHCCSSLTHLSLINCHLPCNVTVWKHLHIAPGKSVETKVIVENCALQGRLLRSVRSIVGQLAIGSLPEGRGIQVLTPLEETESYQSQI